MLSGVCNLDAVLCCPSPYAVAKGPRKFLTATELMTLNETGEGRPGRRRTDRNGGLRFQTHCLCRLRHSRATLGCWDEGACPPYIISFTWQSYNRGEVRTLVGRHRERLAAQLLLVDSRVAGHMPYVPLKPWRRIVACRVVGRQRSNLQDSQLPIAPGAALSTTGSSQLLCARTAALPVEVLLAAVPSSS
jgi:hypothetical protein